MSTVRTVSKKSTGAYARKMAKKVTLNDVWAGFVELQKAHAETEAAIKETQKAQQKAHAETEAVIKETQKAQQKAHAETEAAIKETQKAHAETEAAIKETQKAQQKAHAETEAVIKETQKAQQKAHAETEAVIKETQRMLGDLGNKFGDEAEHTLIPGLQGKFKDFGFTFGAMSRNRKINDDKHDIHAEVDAFLENGTQAMAVEVKSRLKSADVDAHVKRMEKLHAYAELHGDRRDLFGALAATVVSDKEREYALENGFYVIEPSGEDVSVTKPEPGPKIWQVAH